MKTKKTKKQPHNPNQDLTKLLLTNGKNMMSNVIKRIEKLKQKQITPILIVGESGSGKEFVAKSFVQGELSLFHKKIKSINCAAYSKGHIQTMLFGYEKGAFTGAIKSKKGLLESDFPVIFLDEIDKADIEIQLALLRYLRTGEIEKLGEEINIANAQKKENLKKKETKKKVIIFGTSANFLNLFRSYQTKSYQITLDELSSHKENDEYKNELIKMIEDNKILLSEKNDIINENTRFVDDFLNRIAPFTILFPPIRHRKEDLSLLVPHFIKKAIEDCKTKIKNISPEVLHFMIMYNWQGNIAELENFIKSGVVFSKNGTILLSGCLELYAGSFGIDDFLKLNNSLNNNPFPNSSNSIPEFSLNYLEIPRSSNYVLHFFPNKAKSLLSHPLPTKKEMERNVREEKKHYIPFDEIEIVLQNLYVMALLDKYNDIDILLHHGIPKKLERKKIEKYFQLKKEFKHKKDIYTRFGFNSIRPFNKWLKDNYLHNRASLPKSKDDII